MHSGRAENGAADARERVLEKAVVEARVVRDEHAVGQALLDVGGDRGKRRRARHHRVRDAGQRLDDRRNRHLRIDERTPFVDARRPAVRVGVDADDPDLRDPVVRGAGSGRFEVDEGQRGSEELH